MENKYDPMSSSGSIQLDFSVLHLWWKNGSAGNDPKTGVAHFGGWCASKSDADEALAEMGLVIPQTFLPQQYRSSSGSAYDVYSSRVVAVAPIIKRTGWMARPDGNQYSKVEILALMATIDMKQKLYRPWGPVKLSGTAFSGLAITDALALWRRKIKPFCTDERPAWAHWAVIGTVRETIYSEPRGKTRKSMITPCEVAVPAEISQAFMDGRFIGPELVAKCNEYREMSMEWAQAGVADKPKPTAYEETQSDDQQADIPF